MECDATALATNIVSQAYPFLAVPTGTYTLSYEAGQDVKPRTKTGIAIAAGATSKQVVAILIV